MTQTEMSPYKELASILHIIKLTKQRAFLIMMLWQDVTNRMVI